MKTFKLSTKLNHSTTPQNGDEINRVLGGSLDTSIATLTLHAEILIRILSLRDNATFLIRPAKFVEIAARYLVKREKGKTRESLKTVVLNN